jgi:hypothetical protein
MLSSMSCARSRSSASLSRSLCTLSSCACRILSTFFNAALCCACSACAARCASSLLKYSSTASLKLSKRSSRCSRAAYCANSKGANSSYVSAASAAASAATPPPPPPPPPTPPPPPLVAVARSAMTPGGTWAAALWKKAVASCSACTRASISPALSHGAADILSEGASPQRSTQCSVASRPTGTQRVSTLSSPAFGSAARICSVSHATLSLGSSCRTAIG